MFSKVFKGDKPGHKFHGNQYEKGSAESHAAAFKKGVSAGKRGGFSSDSPYPKTDSEHEHFVAGLDEGRSQVSARRAKKAEEEVLGSAAQHGLVQKANPQGINQYSTGASRASARQNLEATRQQKLREKLAVGGTIEDGEAKAAGFRSGAHAMTKLRAKKTEGWVGDLGLGAFKK